MAVYLLLGNDEERKVRSVEKLRAERGAESFNAAETSPEAVVAACNSSSLFGGGTFVVVRDLDSWNAAQKAKLVDYLDNPSPDADLVLLGKKLGARERLLSAVKKAGEVHELEQPRGKALVRWTVAHARKIGLGLSEDVASELISRCSDDKLRLVNELEKLALYAGEGTATAEDVETLCSPNLRSSIFAFVDTLAAGDRSGSIRLLEELLATGEPPLRILYMIRRQLRLVARYNVLCERGVPRPEIAKELKVPPFVARKLEEQGQEMSGRSAEEALALVMRLERGLKGGSYLADRLQTELAVLKLAQR